MMFSWKEPIVRDRHVCPGQVYRDKLRNMCPQVTYPSLMKSDHLSVTAFDHSRVFFIPQVANFTLF